MVGPLTQIDVSNIDSIVDPSELSAWDLIAAVVLLVVGYLFARWARSGARRLVNRVDDVPETISNLAGSIAFWSVLILTLIMALTLLGFDTAPVVMVFLIIAIVVVLSGRGLLENFGAGLILQVRSPFAPGEQIVSNDHEGEVLEINGRTTVIRTMDGTVVQIPNSAVVANPIVNLSVEGMRRTRIDVGVEYGTDLDLARRTMLDTATRVEPVLAEPAPEVFVTGFDDSAINFAVRFWHAPGIREGFVVTDAVARAIDRDLKQKDIVIAFPQATLWWGDAAPDTGHT